MRWIFWLAIVGSTGDNLSTWYCLAHRGHILEEANPMVAPGIATFGLTQLMLAQWVMHMVFLTAAYFVHVEDPSMKKIKRGLHAVWAVLRWYAVANNLTVLYMCW